MSRTHRQHQPEVDWSLPETLDTAEAKLVYLYLDRRGEATIDELQAALRMKKITLYPVLQTLAATGRVDRSGGQYVCQPRPPDEGAE